MILRAAKTSLVFAVAIFYSFVVFNNLTDYNSNYQFIRHVLMMDSTFPGNHGMWRAMNSPRCTPFSTSPSSPGNSSPWFSAGGEDCASRALCRGTAAAFHLAKRVAIAALTLGLLMWLVAFLTFGAEWFLMWQSKTWNGQDAAFRMFTVIGITSCFSRSQTAEQQP